MGVFNTTELKSQGWKRKEQSVITLKNKSFTMARLGKPFLLEKGSGQVKQGA